MNDALEILEELREIVSTYRYGSPDELLSRLDQFIILKSLEFAPAKGDCVG